MATLLAPDALTTVTALPPVAPASPPPMQHLDFLQAQLQPPSWLWCTPDDSVVLSVRSGLAGAQVSVVLRMWLPDGSWSGPGFSFATIGDRVLRFTSTPLYYGYLVGAAAYSFGTPVPHRGQLYLALQIVRPPQVGFLIDLGMGSDYVTGSTFVQWPYSRCVGAVEGPGMLYSITGTTPAAGADFLQTVPAGARWRIRSVNAQLTTSAAVASRRPGLQITDGANNLQIIDSPIAIAAGQAGFVSWSPGWPNTPISQVANTQFLPPDLILGAGDTFGSFTGALQGGDQWGTIHFEVEEWLED